MKSETVKMAAARTCTILALACAAAAFSATAFLPARAVTTHYMPQADLAYSGGFITSEGALVFPGKTLADLEGCGFWGRIAGNAIAFVKTALSNAVKPYPAGAAGDAIERYDFDLVAHEGEHVKAVHIQLYNGEGGVWAKAVKAWYVKTGQSGMPTIHYTVHGTFTPASAYFTAATMMDGSTIDLSKKTEVWSTTSSSLNANTLQFAPGGTVKVEMGEREIDFGESDLVKIVSWTEKPAGVKFKTTVPKRYSLSSRDDGLYCVKTSGTVVFVR